MKKNVNARGIMISYLLKSFVCLAFLGTFSSCAYLRIDPMHPLVRSDYLMNMEQERAVREKARLGWTEDGTIRVLYVQGNAYERGYQHGALLRKEVQDNLGYLYRHALKTFRSEELFAEAYERLRPFIPQEYIDEMHGLAHGSKMPLHIIHAVHALPSMTEWGGKSHVKEVIKSMMNGELGTSCSNIGALSSSTQDGKMYAVRILDWGMHRISKLHEYPLLLVAKPDNGHSFVNIGWVGFLGAISGMNSQGITLGEMGYGSPPNETLRGKPMPFLLRDVLQHASNLKDVRKILKESPGTNSFVFVMSDGKSNEAELYVKDRDRFVANLPGTPVQDGDVTLPAISGISYGGHYEDRMAEVLQQYRGRINPELLMKTIIPDIAMPSNFQNVVYSPTDLKFWVSNAPDKKTRAAEGKYSFFDFGKALQEY